MDEGKSEIIRRFQGAVKGQPIDLSEYKGAHDGKEGHWLERRMGIVPNGNNAPDIFGYEMKKEAPRITFGDWSASEYLFSKRRFGKIPNVKLSKIEFLRFFGTPNPEKGGRLSWSGKCFPKVGEYNEFGQKLVIDVATGDVTAMYSTAHDTRPDKPQFGEVAIAWWSGPSLRAKLLNKFGVKGFFMCKKVGGVYQKICFGNPITFDFFIQKMMTGEIFIDSGMYEGNARQYSQFRANKNLWDSLITEEY